MLLCGDGFPDDLHIKYSVLFRIYNLLPIFEEFVINLLKK